MTVFAVAADDSTAVPATLKAWKAAGYSERCFLKVDAPGEAGNAGLHGDSMFACVLLPLKLRGQGEERRPEPVALFGEDGTLQPVFTRAVAGGSESEIAFATYPGQRRFCLYYGSAEKPPDQVSPLNVIPVPLMVKLRGVSSPITFIYDRERPLSLERFLKMETETQAAPLAVIPSPLNPGANPNLQPNVDDAECPFFAIPMDIFDHIKEIHNPLRYAALYEGFLRCPVDGIYKFAVDTPGVAHVVIDGTPVVKGGAPDDHRAPFALNGSAQLSAGVHRVVVHYAEASSNPDQSNVDQRRFGLRLHWQPPFASAFMCVPPLAFVKALPAVVSSFESAPGTEHPGIHVEVLGHVRSGAHGGDKGATEWVLVFARAAAINPTETISMVSEESPTASAPTVRISGIAGQRALCAWVPAGRPTAIEVAGQPATKRAFLWPTLATGAKDAMEREVMDLEAELLVKSAPEFIYPNETGHIHVEAVLSPKPVIIHKTRFDTRDMLGWEMLPPYPRPMGQFLLTYRPDSVPEHAQVSDATPSEGERLKKRVSFNAAELESRTRSQAVQQSLELSVDGVPCQKEEFAILHAYAPQYPGKLMLDNGTLVLQPKDSQERQRVIVIVPHEDESAHRHLAPLNLFSGVHSYASGLFVGDPLSDSAASTADGKAPVGSLPEMLVKNTASIKWELCMTPGPHRYSPLLGMLAELEKLRAARPNTKLPPLVVINLGGADAARQTPLHIFERALFTLTARLISGGAERIIIVGVIPEPWREKQAEPYQERVDTVVRQHHINGVDVFHLWTPEKNWTRRFSATGNEKDEALLSTPNAGALEEIVQQIQSRL